MCKKTLVWMWPLHLLCLPPSGSWPICPIRRLCPTRRSPSSTSCPPHQVILSVPPPSETWNIKSFYSGHQLADGSVWTIPSPGLFTLILAAIFPSNSSDRFTLSKLLAVALRWVNFYFLISDAVENFSLMLVCRFDETSAVVFSCFSAWGALLWWVCPAWTAQMRKESQVTMVTTFCLFGVCQALLLYAFG